MKGKYFEINTTVFFILIFIYQVLVIFQGVDLLDEGFHVSFYQQFFKDPQSVQYSFFYWLSGLLGGSVLQLFPEQGLWGLRFAGAVISTATIMIAYNLLKNYINTNILKISFIVLVLFINTEPRDLNYNSLTAFIYFASCYFLFKGLTDSRNSFIFIGAALISLNIFTRFPNLLGLGLGLVIFYHGYINAVPLKIQLKRFAFFSMGAILMLAAMLLILKQMGHLEYYTNSIKYLFSMGGSTTKKDGLDGGYGFFKLLYFPLKQYAISIGSVVAIFSLIFISAYFIDPRKYSGKIQKSIIQIVPLFFIVALTGLIVTDKIKLPLLLYFFIGLCLFFSLLILIFSSKKEIQLLSIMGIFIIVVFPFGSAPGIISIGLYSMWLSFPIAIDYLLSIKSIDADFKFQTSQALTQPKISISNSQMRRIMNGGLVVILFLCVYHIFNYPYFYDHHRRTEMVHGIDNKNMKFIYTSKGRADAINELLKTSSSYMKKDDYVLAFDAIPMFHFMTETKAFLKNPCPSFYSTGIFTDEMNNAIENKPLPVVVRQKIKTAHEGSRWPEEIVINDYFTEEKNIGRNDYFNSFLQKYQYEEVWSNEIFAILVPKGKK